MIHEFGAVQVDDLWDTVHLEGKLVQVPTKECQLLAKLVASAGMAVSRMDLLTGVWGYSPNSRTRTVDVHVCRLRRRLNGHCEIETVFGVGYRLLGKL